MTDNNKELEQYEKIGDLTYKLDNYSGTVFTISLFSFIMLGMYLFIYFQLLSVMFYLFIFQQLRDLTIRFKRSFTCFTLEVFSQYL